MRTLFLMVISNKVGGWSCPTPASFIRYDWAHTTWDRSRWVWQESDVWSWWHSTAAKPSTGQAVNTATSWLQCGASENNF